MHKAEEAAKRREKGQSWACVSAAVGVTVGRARQLVKEYEAAQAEDTTAWHYGLSVKAKNILFAAGLTSREDAVAFMSSGKRLPGLGAVTRAEINEHLEDEE